MMPAAEGSPTNTQTLPPARASSSLGNNRQTTPRTATARPRSDLQLERINVYFNEATGGERRVINQSNFTILLRYYYSNAKGPQAAGAWAAAAAPVRRSPDRAGLLVAKRVRRAGAGVGGAWGRPRVCVCVVAEGGGGLLVCALAWERETCTVTKARAERARAASCEAPLPLALPLLAGGVP